MSDVVLPAGWFQSVNETGLVYYYDVQGRVSWKPPPPRPSAPSEITTFAEEHRARGGSSSSSSQHTPRAAQAQDSAATAPAHWEEDPRDYGEPWAHPTPPAALAAEMALVAATMRAVNPNTRGRHVPACTTWGGEPHPRLGVGERLRLGYRPPPPPPRQAQDTGKAAAQAASGSTGGGREWLVDATEDDFATVSNEAFTALPPALGFRGAVVDVFAADEHSFLRTSMGLVYSWGRNVFGQLGHGDVEARSVPVLVAALSHVAVTSLSCGGSHALCLTVPRRATEDAQVGSTSTPPPSAGAARDRPVSSSGKPGTPQQQAAPLRVPATPKAQAKAAAAAAAVAAAGGQLWAWGKGRDGQLGCCGDLTDGHLPRPVGGPLSGVAVAAMSAGASVSLAATAKDGALYAWGNNSRGLLGLGDAEPPKPSKNATAAAKAALATQRFAKLAALKATGKSGGDADNPVAKSAALAQKLLADAAKEKQLAAEEKTGGKPARDPELCVAWPAACPALPAGVVKVAAGKFHCVAVATRADVEAAARKLAGRRQQRWAQGRQDLRAQAGGCSAPPASLGASGARKDGWGRASSGRARVAPQVSDDEDEDEDDDEDDDSETSSVASSSAHPTGSQPTTEDVEVSDKEVEASDEDVDDDDSQQRSEASAGGSRGSAPSPQPTTAAQDAAAAKATAAANAAQLNADVASAAQAQARRTKGADEEVSDPLPYPGCPVKTLTWRGAEVVLLTWGYGDRGGLGLGPNNMHLDVDVPTRLPVPNAQPHVCAVKPATNAALGGRSGGGRQGSGGASGEAEEVLDLVASDHTVLLTATASGLETHCYSWGANDYGKCGVAVSTSGRATFAQAGSSSAAAATAGASEAGASKAKAASAAASSSSHGSSSSSQGGGKSGGGEAAAAAEAAAAPGVAVPTAMLALEGLRVRRVAAGGFATLACTCDGRLFASGYGGNGFLLDPQALRRGVVNNPKPLELTSLTSARQPAASDACDAGCPARDVLSVSLGMRHAVALTAHGGSLRELVVLDALARCRARLAPPTASLEKRGQQGAEPAHVLQHAFDALVARQGGSRLLQTLLDEACQRALAGHPEVVAGEALEQQLVALKQHLGHAYAPRCLKQALAWCWPRAAPVALAHLAPRLVLVGGGRAPGGGLASPRKVKAAPQRTKGDPNFDDGAEFK